MAPINADQDLLDRAARRLGVDAEVLLERYYGTAADAREQLDELSATGALQASFARTLRRELIRLNDAGPNDLHCIGSGRSAAAT